MAGLHSVVCLSILCFSPTALAGARGSAAAHARACARAPRAATHMLAKKGKGSGRRKGKQPAPAKISLKGFGAKPVPAVDGELGMLLNDAAYERLHDWLVREGANLARVGIADFDGLRGVIALQARVNKQTRHLWVRQLHFISPGHPESVQPPAPLLPERSSRRFYHTAPPS